MKQCVKRIYCPTCKKLVRCHEKEEGNKLHVICNRCANQILSRQKNVWRYVKADAK